jgi:hypothetical protein
MILVFLKIAFSPLEKKMESLSKIITRASNYAVQPSLNKEVLKVTIFFGLVALNFIPELAMAQYNVPGPSLAGSSNQSIGGISRNITTSLAGAAGVVTALAYLGAVSFAFIGALKWKAYGEQPDRTPLKVPVTYWGIASICAALPEFIGTGITTLWGSGATLVSPI